jgi:16S rRNA C967 or C1407 C5-methylase (RsmB/RsmF family)
MLLLLTMNTNNDYTNITTPPNHNCFSRRNGSRPTKSYGGVKSARSTTRIMSIFLMILGFEFILQQQHDRSYSWTLTWTWTCNAFTIHFQNEASFAKKAARFGVSRSTKLLLLGGDGDNNNDNEISSEQLNPQSHLTPSWEETLIQMATEALVPVFYPNVHANTANNIPEEKSDNSNLINIQSEKYSLTYVEPEKALKKLLRQFQKRISSSSSSPSAETEIVDIEIMRAEERHASRKILADLVLGTSIMRIRHYYSLLAILHSRRDEYEHKHEYEHESIDYLLSVKLKDVEIEPIMGVVDNASREFINSKNIESDENNRFHLVKAMVKIHFEYAGMGKGMRENMERYRYDKDTTTSILINYTSEKGIGKSTGIAERISILYSLPVFFVEMLVEQYGPKVAEEIACVFNEPGPITIRRNGIKCPSDKILCERLLRDHSITAIPLSDNDDQSSDGGNGSNSTHSAIHLPSNGGIRLVVNKHWSPAKKSIWSLDSWKDGWFEVQDAGSQLIAKATEAAGGDIVVDYCAGNGGKTFALASQMYEKAEEEQQDGTMKHRDYDRKGLVVAHDIVEDRLRQLQGSFDRTGLSPDELNLSNPKVVVTTTLDPKSSLKKEMADLVLVDAPCSSTGVLRRRPSQRFKLKKDEIVSKFPPLQKCILKEGSELVKVGGRLVYATCSLSRHENEGVVEAFESCTDFDSKWEHWIFDGKDQSDNGHCFHILPNLNGTDGFFIARWKRRC